MKGTRVDSITENRTGRKYISLEDMIDALRNDIDPFDNEFGISDAEIYIKNLIERLKEMR